MKIRPLICLAFNKSSLLAARLFWPNSFVVQAASEVAGSDIAKASKSEVPAEKDRTQKSSIPLPPASAKAAAAAAATA